MKKIYAILYQKNSSHIIMSTTTPVDEADTCFFCLNSISRPRGTGRVQRPVPNLPSVPGACRQCCYEAWFYPGGFYNSPLWQAYLKTLEK